MPTFRKRSTKPRKRNRNTKKNQNNFRKNVMRGGFATADFSHAIAVSAFFGKKSFYVARKDDIETKNMTEYDFTNPDVRFANRKFMRTGNANFDGKKTSFFKPTQGSVSGSAIKNFDIYVSVVDKEYIKMDKNNWSEKFKEMLKALEEAAVGNADAIIESLPDQIKKNATDAVEDIGGAAIELQKIVANEIADIGSSAIDVINGLAVVEHGNAKKYIVKGMELIGMGGEIVLGTVTNKENQKAALALIEYISKKIIYLVWALMVGLFILLKFIVNVVGVIGKTGYVFAQEKYSEFQAQAERDRLANEKTMTIGKESISRPSIVLPAYIPMEPEAERLFIENLAKDPQKINVENKNDKCDFAKKDSEYKNFIARKLGGDDLNTTYRKLALKFHPSRIQQFGCTQEQIDIATEMFKAINAKRTDLSRT